MTATAQRGIDQRWWDDFQPPPGYIAEIILGELVVTPSPCPAHGEAQFDLHELLRPGLPEGFVILQATEWRLAVEGLVAAAPQPDLLVVPRGLDAVTDPPLLAVEVLSPSDLHLLPDHASLTRIEGKRLDYARNGLRHYLEVDTVSSPGSVRLARFGLRDGALVEVEAVRDDGSIDAAVPFPYVVPASAFRRH